MREAVELDREALADIIEKIIVTKGEMDFFEGPELNIWLDYIWKLKFLEVADAEYLLFTCYEGAFDGKMFTVGGRMASENLEEIKLKVIDCILENIIVYGTTIHTFENNLKKLNGVIL